MSAEQLNNENLDPRLIDMMKDYEGNEDQMITDWESYSEEEKEEKYEQHLEQRDQRNAA